MEPIKESKARFENLVELYKKRLSEIEVRNDLSVAFSSSDYFSLEPYYAEFNNISDDDVGMVASIEDLPPDSDIYYLQLDLKIRKLLQVRQYYEKDIYYDSVFIYEDQSQWRYQIYTNNGEIKPICVEYFETNELNYPMVYEKISKWGLQKNTYSWTDEGETVQCLLQIEHHGDEGDVRPGPGYFINMKLDENLDGLKLHTIREKGNNILIYSKEDSKKGLPQLLKEAKEALLKAIEKTLKTKNGIFTGDIAFCLFEYTLQGPFPPTLALATQKEWEGEENPILPYNAPDIMYFSENEEYSFDFYTEGESVFRSINSIVKKMDSEESQKLVREFYIDLCKDPKLKALFTKYLSLIADFHITAGDFEAFDVEEMLPLTVPEKIWKNFEQRKAEYNASGINSDTK